MKTYAIFAGLGGGAQFICAEEHKTEESAMYDAEMHALEIYESYGAMQGLEDYSFDDFREEYPDADEAEYAFMERENFEEWADYWVEEYDEDKDYA
jgi:hypothetical protein